MSGDFVALLSLLVLLSLFVFSFGSFGAVA
jgi:hypothetical protein